MAHVGQKLGLGVGRRMSEALSFDQFQRLALARIDIQDEVDDLSDVADVVQPPVPMQLHPASRTRRQDGAHLNGLRLEPVAPRGRDQRRLIG